MDSRLSLRSLAATLLPAVYSSRYEENLATGLNSQLSPYERPAQFLEQLHVPLRFRERATGGSAGSQAESKAIDIWDVLFRSPRVAIVGEPGAGKTATLKYVAIALAQRKMPESYIRRLTFLHQGQAFDHLLPIYADLSQIGADTDDMAVFLASTLANYGFPGATGFLRARLTEGSCLLLLDSFVPDTPAHRARLRKLLAAYPKAQVLVAARMADWVNTFPDWRCFEPLPFSEAEMETYIRKRLGKDSPAAVALLQALERHGGLRSMAENPLLLAVLSWTSEGAQSLPLQLQQVYDRCLQALCGEGTGTTATSAQAMPDRNTGDRVLQEIGRYFHEGCQERFTGAEVEAAVKKAGELLGHPGEEHSLLALVQNTRLLRRENEEQCAFLRLTLQEFLTAQAVVGANRFTELLREHMDDPWWREVIVFATALLGNATDVIPQVLTSSRKPEEALFLAARCAAEAPTIAQDMKEGLRRQLFQAFADGDAARRHAAAVCIAALEGQRVCDYFPGMLKDGSVDERELAALVIGKVGRADWATVPLLGALDKSRPWQVRRRAAWALGQLGDKRAVPALVEMLKDQKEEVAGEVAVALSVIGEPAVPSLISALSGDRPMVREMAVKALGKMGSLAVKPLLRIVQDEKQPDATVGGAAEALGLLGDAQVVPHLISLLRARGGNIVEGVARALASIGQPAVQPLIDALPTRRAELEVRKAIVDALVAIAKPSIEPLIHSLNHPSVPVRNAAEEALTHIGAPATEALVAALRTEDWNLRRRIAEILTRIGDKRLAEPLVSALGDNDPGVRARAAQVLGQVGQESAVEPLIEAMRHDPDEFVRRLAVKALAELRSERAIGPLIEVLADSQLRDMGVHALTEIGEAAVEAIILALNRGQNSGVQQACIRALDILGARSRIEDPTMSAVAKVYALLLTQELLLEEMVALLQCIRWWKQGEELHRAFSSAQILARARSLSEVAQCAEELAWVHALESPFRPGIKDILRDLSNVAQSVRLYLNDPRREGQRDAMLSAINTMAGIQKKIDTQLLEFEKKPFVDIMETWQRLTEEAIEGLRGRAQLEIAALRDELPLDRTQLSAKIVFRLANEGDSAARNLSATLKPSGGQGFEVIGPATQRLDPLGSGMERQVEFRLKPLDVADASYVFEVSYEDDEAITHHRPFSGRVRFFTLGEQYRPIPSSPYVTGPVKTPQLFYGRQDVLDWMRGNISGAYQENILVLHGERRMGKTSILYQLLYRPLTPQHICVFFSLELATTSSLGDLFYDMAVEIYEAVTAAGFSLPQPEHDGFVRNAQRAFRNLCAGVENVLGDRRLLIMMDEIDILIAKVEEGALSADVFHFLRGLMQHTDKIAFIVTGAYKVREMLKDNTSILFNMARPYKISYLHPNEAKALILEPVAGYLTYDELVVEKILRVSACHPYFIQCICDSLVKLAQRTCKNFVSSPDLDLVLQDVVQDNTGNLHKTVYAVLSRPEQQALAALANVTDDYRIFVPPDMVAQMLEQHRLGIAKPKLANALHALSERDLVIEKRIGQSLQYGFKMDLIRMWLRQNEVLLRLSQEMKI